MDFLICNKLIIKKWVLFSLVIQFKNHEEYCGFLLHYPCNLVGCYQAMISLVFQILKSAKWIGPSVHMYLSSNSLATTLNTNTMVINSQVFNSRMEYRIRGKSNGVDIVTPNNRRKSNHKVFE